MKKYRLLILIILLLLAIGGIPDSCFGQFFPAMPVATVTPPSVTQYDTAKTTNTSTSPVTLTINAASDGFVIIWVSSYYASTGDTWNTPTIGGTSATEVYKYTSGEDHLGCWYVKGTTSGSKTISIDKTNASAEYCVVAVSYQYVNTGTATGTVDYNTGSGSDPTATTNSSATGELVLQGFRYYNVGVTMGADETAVVSSMNGSSMSSILVTRKAGAASVSIDPTVDAWTQWHRIAVPIKP